MSINFNKNFIKKLVSVAGVASASILLCLPTLAQGTPGNERNNVCGGYEGNATTGGGYPCAREQQNRQFSNRRGESEFRRTAPEGSSNTGNEGSTTGAGYPGNGVRPQGVDDRSNQDSVNPGSDSVNPDSNTQNDMPTDSNTQNDMPTEGSSNTGNDGSTTGAGSPGNNVRPQGVDNQMNR